MAIRTDNSFSQFIPNVQKTEEIQIRPVAQVEGGLPDLKGVQSMAQVAADISRETEAIGKVLQAQERERQFSSAVADFGIKSLEAELEASQKPYKESVPYLVDKLEKTRSDLAGQITDTKARLAFSQHAQQTAVPTISKMTWASKKREIGDNLNQVHVNLDKTLLAFNADNPEATLKLGQNIIDKAVENHLFEPEHGLVLTEGLKDKIDEMGVQDLINNIYKGQIDPDEAIGKINDMNNFTNVDPVIRKKAIQEVTTVAEHMRNVAINKKEHDEDRVYVLMRRDQEENANSLSSRMLDSLKGVSKESLNVIELDVLKDLKSKRIDKNDATFLFALVKSSREGPTYDDPMVYANHSNNIDLGKGDPNAFLHDPSLKTETKIGLWNQFKAQRDSVVDVETQNGLSKLRAAIVSTGPGAIKLGDMEKQEQYNLANANTEFKRLVAEVRKSGKTPNYDGIVGAVLNQYANKRSLIAIQPNLYIKIGGKTETIVPTINPDGLKAAIKLASGITDPKEKAEASRTIQYWFWMYERLQIESGMTDQAPPDKQEKRKQE